MTERYWPMLSIEGRAEPENCPDCGCHVVFDYYHEISCIGCKLKLQVHPEHLVNFNTALKEGTGA